MKAPKTPRLDKSSRDLEKEQRAELERSNDSLRESERRLRELIDGLPVAVYTTDADGYLTLYNEAAVAFWGRRPVLGKDRWCGSWKLYSADGAPMPSDRCPLAIALREQRPVRDIEVTAERPDGIRLTFIPHPTPLRDASGKLIGAMNVLVDITERKRAETELNAARQQLMSELANMTRLHEVSMRFVQQGELHGLLDQILDAAIGITGADKGNIQLLDNDEHTLRIATQRGFSSDFLEFFSSYQQGRSRVRNRPREDGARHRRGRDNEPYFRWHCRSKSHVVRGLPGSAVDSAAHARRSFAGHIFDPLWRPLAVFGK